MLIEMITAMLSLNFFLDNSAFVSIQHDFKQKSAGRNCERN